MSDTNKLPAEVLAEALKPFLPIMITENRDYAEVTFGDHQTQAMTMAPQDWIALEAAAEALLASPGPALEAENARLREAERFWREACDTRVAFVREMLTDLIESHGGPTERRATIQLSPSDVALWLIKLGSVGPTAIAPVSDPSRPPNDSNQPTDGPFLNLSPEQWRQLQERGRLEANGVIYYRDYSAYVEG